MTKAHKLGVYMVHGLFGHPDEYKALATNLQVLGYHTGTPSLLAHGDRRDVPLKDIHIEDLIAIAQADFEAFSSQCESVVLLGHSLGGLLSGMLAANQPANLRALVMVSAPYERAYTVDGLWSYLKIDVDRFFPSLRYLPQAKTGLPRPKFRLWWKKRLVEESRALFDLAKHRLPDIDVPTWLLHSPYDLVVPYEEMMALANAIERPDLVKIVPLSDCGHQVFPTSREQLTVMKTLLEAIEVAKTSQNESQSASQETSNLMEPVYP